MKRIRLLTLILSLFVMAQNAFAQCTINGQEVPCDQFWSQFGLIFIIMGVVFLGMFAFWLWMFIDCIRRDFKDKVMWIIILLVANVLGAVIYLFVVKRKGTSEPPIQN